jgi:adenylosuccinate lyase
MIERYTRPEMQKIWSEEFKYETWLKIEVLACEARSLAGEVPVEDLEIIKTKAQFNKDRILEIENEVQHDVIAFLTNVAEYVGEPSRHIHFGMTSSDVLDTALSYQMKTAAELILSRLNALEAVLREKAILHKYTYCIGRTHGVHAEPTTFGLKFLNWQQETVRNITRLGAAKTDIAVGMISGAVGTFDHLPPTVEEYVCSQLGLAPAPVSTQIIQRDRHAHLMNVLSVIGGGLEKIATEIRHLQKTETREAEEGFAKGQKGSSAMPHKRNPIVCERICGLARLLRGYATTANENIALWHERDISHSSVERIIVPDAFIALDYMLHLSIKLIENLSLFPEKMLENLNLTRGLIYSQKALLLLTKKGVRREDAYAAVQKAAMKVWNTPECTLLEELLKEEKVTALVSEAELSALFKEKPELLNLDRIFERVLGS